MCNSKSLQPIYTIYITCNMSEFPTPIHRACYSGDVDKVRTLASQNCTDLNVGNQQDYTPLLIAVSNGHASVVKCLLDEFHCSPTIKGFKGKSLLHLASGAGHVELAEMLLIQYKLNPLSVDDNGDTPLHLAALYGREEVAKLLITKFMCPVDCVNNRLQTPLHYACHRGHLNLIKMLVCEYYADLNARDTDNNTPLHVAALNGHTNLVKVLLDEFNCSPTIKGRKGKSLLHLASGAGHVEVAEMLLIQYKLNPLSVDDNGDTPLHLASLYGREEVAKLLITKYMCPVDCVNSRQRTPLHYACSRGYLNLVKMLVCEYYADLNARDTDKNTPLHVAATNGHTNIVVFLVDDIHCTPTIKGFRGRNIVHWASKNGLVDMVELLFSQHYLDPLSVDDNGDTPLHLAALYGREEVAKLLIIKYKCPVDCLSNRQQTPLHYACISGHLNLVKMLVCELNADLYTRDTDNNPPLHVAAMNGRTDVVRCLLDMFKCSPAIKGFEGRTILHWACSGGHVELAELLMTKYMLDPLSVNDYGSTPLHLAALCGREEVAKLLITKYECPIDCANNGLQTPLHCACREGHLNLIRMLVCEFGANLSARDYNNDMPLHIAASAGQCSVTVVESLINDFQCDPLVKGFLGRNLLHQSCAEDNDSLVKELVYKYNLSLLSPDNDGNTPLHIASMYGSVKSLKFLLNNYQAPVFLRNKAGKSAFDVARNDEVTRIINKYVSSQHSRIIYDYKKVQALSTERYKGAHKLTRVFVVGNSESGKSTLVESLKREGLFSFLSSVSEATVPSHTSGIIPSVYYSKTIGRVIYYDFAGDPDYYSSHSAIVSNVLHAKMGNNFFLVVVNLTEAIPTIQEELGKWFSFISYNVKNLSVKCEVLVVGTHADLITRADETTKLLSVSQHITNCTTDASKHSFEIIDVLTVNCRQPRSLSVIKRLLQIKVENSPFYNLSEEAAILLGVLEKDFRNVVTCTLQTLISHIQDTGIFLPTMASALYKIVEELYYLGLLLKIKNDNAKLEETLLILDIPKLTNELHEILFSETSHVQYTCAGVFPLAFLNKLLSECISVDCLVQLEYCQPFSHAKVTRYDQSVVLAGDSNVTPLLYFPALCKTERNESILITPKNYYTHNIGWYAECQKRFDYFPARFLHVLLLRLAYSFAHPIAPCESEGESGPRSDVVKSNCRCTMWKNGLHWHMEEGVECAVELVSNSRGLVVITKSTEEAESKSKCAEMLFKIKNVSMKAKEEFCDTVTLKQYSMPLDCKHVLQSACTAGYYDLTEIVLSQYNLDPLSVDDNGDTPLHLAALYGREEVAKLLVTKFMCPVDCVNNRLQTPLHYACSRGYLNLVRMFVHELNADLNARDTDNNTPLHVAALNGHNNLVKCLLDEFHCSPTIKGFKGESLLHLASGAGHVEVAEMLLIQYNLDLLLIDDNGDTPLHLAALYGREEVAKLLITNFKCPVDCVNKRQQTPLHYACSRGRLNLIKMLVCEFKADMNALDKFNDTPLHTAVLHGPTEVLEYLINDIISFETPQLASSGANCELASSYSYENDDRTCDPDSHLPLRQQDLGTILTQHYVNYYGSGPLHWAALGGKEEVAKLLITKYRCSVDCVNINQQTPLHFACRKGHLSFVRMLVSEFKAALNAKSEDGDTPLHEAALNGHADIVECLVSEFGCNPNSKGFGGRNILHETCATDIASLVQKLIDGFGLCLLSTDNHGNTPLHIASMHGSVKSLHFLLSNYAQAPVLLRNNAGKFALDVAVLNATKGILSEYTTHHHHILLDYEELKVLSSERYKGPHRLTRVFVVGNAGSGKSSLIESMKKEGFFLSSRFNFSKIRVPPHTSGIVPSEDYSQTLGRILYYDFAGDSEYYSSHSAVISSVLQAPFGNNVFLVVVNFTKAIPSINEELGYWFKFLSYHDRNQCQQSEMCSIVLVIGSHEDCIGETEKKTKLLSVRQFVSEYILSEAPKFSFDAITLNCCKPWSVSNAKDLILKTIRSTPTHHLSGEATILLGLLEEKFKKDTTVTCKLQTLIKCIKSTGIQLPTRACFLYPIVKELHTLGLIMCITGGEDKVKNCLLVLNLQKLTSEVHECLFSDKIELLMQHASIGVLPQTVLTEILPDCISVDFLIQLQYCQLFSHAEVNYCDQSVTCTDDPKSPSLLYFPALCKVDRKRGIVTPPDFTYIIGWYAECQKKFDYFPPRFLHVLLLRLAYSFARPIAPCESEGESGPHSDVVKSNCRCTMWKNGLHWHMEEGVECAVELVSNSRGLVVITKSTEEAESKSKCAEMLFKIKNVSMKAKEEFCDTVTLKQYLLPLDCKDLSSFKDRTKFFDLQDVRRVLKEGNPRILSIRGEHSLNISSISHMSTFLIEGKLTKL